ncbi:MAG TPA: hypothetical protein VM529_07875 [Gemmata sp.]|nr:hypothetical protein [Gemmata sp.]
MSETPAAVPEAVTALTDTSFTEVPEPVAERPPVDPARSEAGRRGGERFHQLVRLGREYEREHRLSPGRQRLKLLVQLGKRYEEEHGLAVAKRKRPRGDAWAEFLAVLSRVVRPKYRAAIEQLAAQLGRREPRGEAA